MTSFPFPLDQFKPNLIEMLLWEISTQFLMLTLVPLYLNIDKSTFCLSNDFNHLLAIVNIVDQDQYEGLFKLILASTIRFLSINS